MGLNMGTKRIGREWLPFAACGALLAGCGSMDSGKKAEPRADLAALRITEVHYHPADQDTISGDEYEFVEIKNGGAAELDLSNVGFAEGIEFTFPKGTKIGAGKFLVVASVPARFKERYGFAADGAFTGKLSNSGETLALEDLPAQAVLASITWSDGGAWPAGADGVGYSLVPAAGAKDTGAAAWRASFRIGGSPGKDDVGAPLISEVSSHTDPPDYDAIELYNPESAPMDIGGWWLSDDVDDPAKFKVPAGTTLPANGYALFREKDFNKDSTSSRSFNLSAHGDDVWLFADSGGCAKGYCHGVEFGEIRNGVTFGRHVAGDGSAHFPAQSRPTLGSANAAPLVGPVVISEIMYHASDDTADYLELANPGAAPVAMFDTANPANTWKIEGLAFKFPAGITLAAGERVLVIPARATPARVRGVYSLDSTVRIFQAAGELNNATDTLVLMRPEEPYVEAGETKVPFMVIDRVAYRDNAPWPKTPDGEGNSLSRKALDAFGDDGAAWSGSAPTPGKPAK